MKSKINFFYWRLILVTNIEWYLIELYLQWEPENIKIIVDLATKLSLDKWSKHFKRYTICII